MDRVRPVIAEIRQTQAMMLDDSKCTIADSQKLVSLSEQLVNDVRVVDTRDLVSEEAEMSADAQTAFLRVQRTVRGIAQYLRTKVPQRSQTKDEQRGEVVEEEKAEKEGEEYVEDWGDDDG